MPFFINHQTALNLLYTFGTYMRINFSAAGRILTPSFTLLKKPHTHFPELKTGKAHKQFNGPGILL